MRKLVRTLLKPINLYIALALLAANGLAWAALTPADTYDVELVLAPGLADLRDRVNEGGHSGESFELHLTSQEATESLAWLLAQHPEVPFHRPRIAFHPGRIECWGEAEVLGLRLSLHGWATIVLEDSAPIITLTNVEVSGAPVPGFVLEAVQDEFHNQVSRSTHELPIVLETLELREGEAVATGTIR